MCLCQVLYPLCISQEKVATFQDFGKFKKVSSDLTRRMLGWFYIGFFCLLLPEFHLEAFIKAHWFQHLLLRLGSPGRTSAHRASVSTMPQFQPDSNFNVLPAHCEVRNFVISSVVSITEAFKKQKEWVWQPDFMMPFWCRWLICFSGFVCENLWLLRSWGSHLAVGRRHASCPMHVRGSAAWI